jgi:hypothetical protein
MFFTELLPVGARWRIISVLVGVEELPVSVDFSPDHPGLLLPGSLEILRDAEEASQVRSRAAPLQKEFGMDGTSVWLSDGDKKELIARIAPPEVTGLNGQKST